MQHADGFRHFLNAVADSGLSEGVAEATAHTSAVTVSDWKRIQDALAPEAGASDSAEEADRPLA